MVICMITNLTTCLYSFFNKVRTLFYHLSNNKESSSTIYLFKCIYNKFCTALSWTIIKCKCYHRLVWVNIISHHSQAAVLESHGPALVRAQPARRPRLGALFAARGGARGQAGGRPPYPLVDRLRRADSGRPAPGDEGLRKEVLNVAAHELLPAHRIGADRALSATVACTPRAAALKRTDEGFCHIAQTL